MAYPSFASAPTRPTSSQSQSHPHSAAGTPRPGSVTPGSAPQQQHQQAINMYNMVNMPPGMHMGIAMANSIQPGYPNMAYGQQTQAGMGTGAAQGTPGQQALGMGINVAGYPQYPAGQAGQAQGSTPFAGFANAQGTTGYPNPAMYGMGQTSTGGINPGMLASQQQQQQQQPTSSQPQPAGSFYAPQGSPSINMQQQQQQRPNSVAPSGMYTAQQSPRIQPPNPSQTPQTNPNPAYPSSANLVQNPYLQQLVGQASNSTGSPLNSNAQTPQNMQAMYNAVFSQQHQRLANFAHHQSAQPNQHQQQQQQQQQGGMSAQQQQQAAYNANQARMANFGIPGMDTSGSMSAQQLQQQHQFQQAQSAATATSSAMAAYPHHHHQQQQQQQQPNRLGSAGSTASAPNITPNANPATSNPTPNPSVLQHNFVNPAAQAAAQAAHAARMGYTNTMTPSNPSLGSQPGQPGYVGSPAGPRPGPNQPPSDPSSQHRPSQPPVGPPNPSSQPPSAQTQTPGPRMPSHQQQTFLQLQAQAQAHQAQQAAAAAAAAAQQHHPSPSHSAGTASPRLSGPTAGQPHPNLTLSGFPASYSAAIAHGQAQVQAQAIAAAAAAQGSPQPNQASVMQQTGGRGSIPSLQNNLRSSPNLAHQPQPTTNQPGHPAGRGPSPPKPTHDLRHAALSAAQGVLPPNQTVPSRTGAPLDARQRAASFTGAGLPPTQAQVQVQVPAHVDPIIAAAAAASTAAARNRLPGPNFPMLRHAYQPLYTLEPDIFESATPRTLAMARYQTNHRHLDGLFSYSAGVTREALERESKRVKGAEEKLVGVKEDAGKQQGSANEGADKGKGKADEEEASDKAQEGEKDDETTVSEAEKNRKLWETKKRKATDELEELERRQALAIARFKSVGRRKKLKSTASASQPSNTVSIAV